MRKWNVYSKGTDKWGHVRHSRALVWTVSFCCRWGAVILKAGVITGQGKMASCALPPFNLPRLRVNPSPYNSNSTPHSDQQFVLSLQWSGNTFRQHANVSFPHCEKSEIAFVQLYRFHPYTDLAGAHIRCCIASIMQSLQTWEAEDVWIIYISCHGLVWFQRTCSQRPIILPLFAGGDETFSQW